MAQAHTGSLKQPRSATGKTAAAGKGFVLPPKRTPTFSQPLPQFKDLFPYPKGHPNGSELHAVYLAAQAVYRKRRKLYEPLRFNPRISLRDHLIADIGERLLEMKSEPFLRFFTVQRYVYLDRKKFSVSGRGYEHAVATVDAYLKLARRLRLEKLTWESEEK